MEKLATYGAQRGRTIDPGEAGVVLLAYVSDDRSRTQAIIERVSETFHVPAEAMAARCAIGSVQECAETIQRYVEAGCTKYVLFPIVPPDELVPQIESYGRQIVPRFH